MDSQIIVVAEVSSPDGEKGMWGDAKNIVRRIKDVTLPADLLERNMAVFLQILYRVFQQVDSTVRAGEGLQLNEVEL